MTSPFSRSNERAVPDDWHMDLVERSAQANAALMRGDLKRYRDLITITNDFTRFRCKS